MRRILPLPPSSARCAAAALVLAASIVLPAPVTAQQSRAATWEPARDKRFWIGSAALLAAAIPLDRHLRDVALAHQSRGADRVASAVDPLGKAGDILPALAVAVVVPRLVGQRPLADAATRVALDYLVADAVESVLKPAVGRHRPNDGGPPDRFRPFRPKADWNSFPSAHVSHAVALAAGIAGETRNPWVAGAAYGVAGLVGVQRVYRNMHWSSDVVGSAALAVATASTTDAWLRRGGLRYVVRPASERADVRLEPALRGLSVSWTFR